MGLHGTDRDLTGAASVKRQHPKLTALFARRVKAFIKDQNLDTIPEKRQTQRAEKCGRDARDDDEADETTSITTRTRDEPDPGPSSTEAHRH
ncbi:MAG: hypothetical protein SGPRY_002657 [Prymnesium sp.]